MYPTLQAIKAEMGTNEGDLKGLGFPQDCCLHCKWFLKVTLKIAPRATKACKYLNNTLWFIFT